MSFQMLCVNYFVQKPDSTKIVSINRIILEVILKLFKNLENVYVLSDLRLLLEEAPA